MLKKKRMQAILARYGKRPKNRYDDEDLRCIRSYFDHRRAMEPQRFYLDETTWYDLSMDTVFDRVSNTGSASGEQLLYYQIRCPATDRAEYDRRSGLIRLMEQDPALRGKLQLCISGLGKNNAARTIEAFAPAAHGPYRLILALLLFAGLLLSGLSLFFTRLALPLFVLLLCGNPLYHISMIKRLDSSLPAANYSVRLAAAFQQIRRLSHGELAACMQSYDEAGRRTRRLARMGGVSFMADNDIMQLFNSLFLFDLILYEILKIQLSRLRGEVFAVHECIGRIDAAIAVASYRKSVAVTCDPDICFEPDAAPFLTATELVHPLLRRPVANTVELDASLLLTGSNASGKSTLAKAIALNAVLAQGICTALSASYAATAFHIYTSMALTDDLLAGESYFVTELKAFKRILEAAQRGERVLCVIDEVLRGTNTVERIAASSTLLEYLAGRPLLCIAATHDIELCTLLDGHFTMAHFEEAIVDGQIVFDYRLRPGAACTRNAIRLLSQMGFASALTAAAENRAEGYLEKGHW